MNFNFGEVLSRAWQITWKHKVLWIFGILASCSQGGSRFNSGSSGRGGGGTGTGVPPQFQPLFDSMAQNAVAFAAIVLTLACILWIVAAFLGTIGRIGLIRGTWQAESGTAALSFGPLFSESTPYFWRVFGLSLLAGLPFVILIGVPAAALAAYAIVRVANDTSAAPVGLLGLIPLLLGCLCLLIPVAFVVNMVVRQSERAIVLEGLPVLPSLSRGWEIFSRNLGPVILMAILLVVVTFVAGLIFAIPVLLFVVPAALAFAFNNGQNWTPMIIAAGLFCIYLPIGLLLNGIFISYVETAWTLTFLRLTGKPKVDDVLPPSSGTPPPPPPPVNDADKTIISSSHV